MNETSLWAQYRQEVANDPMLALALTAALAALAFTPIAFAILGRLEWFQARRGRVLMRPSFASIVVGMILVMGIPAIFSAMVLKSRSFDRNRYEFDPNKRWSVLEQGRGLKDVQDADAAVKREMDRLATERKNLVENVKKLDEQMLALRAVAGTSVPVAQRVPGVLQALAGVRKSVGLDGPQQLMDFTAPPVDLRGVASVPVPATVAINASPMNASPPTPVAGLPPAEAEAEVASVPEPQRLIAAMLPLSGIPAGWEVAKPGDKHIETFNAENLYEKIDGRAESFVQYGVKGMAYASYHPAGDSDNDVQLYIFEMADPLKALGKYGSEKPEKSEGVAIGDEGYTSAGSTLFHAGRYYTQIVSTSEDPKFAAFALELARRVAAKQKPAGAATSKESGSVASANTEGPGEGSKPATAAVTPATYFGMLPAKGREGEAKYVAQDAFGYSFLSDVFMADYKEGETAWQGFLRPYKDEAEAKSVFQKYIEGVKKDGAEVKSVKAEGADEMVISTNIGLVDVVFRKGNTLAGANGGTAAGPPEQFARGLAKALPASVPPLSN